MRSVRVAVIGAGMGGLVAAVELAAQGFDVTVLERADAPGGKLREVAIGGTRLDVGPTVLTLRPVFEEVFARAGASFADHLTLRPAEILARHAWSEHERLDLFPDVERSAEAIGVLAGPAEARGYRRFCERARHVHDALDQPFMRAPRPSPVSLISSAGLRGAAKLWSAAPFTTLWRALGEHFRDPRLRQLFGRYATYCGASPFRAIATLMLVAHVEREGVWLVEGGMHRLATSLAVLATKHGARFRYGAEVAEVLMAQGRVAGVRLASGEAIAADAVVVNADTQAIASGLFGAAIAGAVPKVPRIGRSLSAMTWAMLAEAEGFPLLRHTVFFSRDYAAEFDDIFGRSRLPAEPTVYVCAEDRGGSDADESNGAAPAGGGGAPERLFCIVNAPANGDARRFTASEIAACETSTFATLQRCGLSLRRRKETTVLTTPAEFEQLFPATGGALYGPALHDSMAPFRRPGARTRLPGLYLAGGSVHPGPGLPMAALSGRQAAASLIADLGSTRRSHLVVTPGGISTR